jgi:thymidylate synthase ThyX
MQDHTREAVIEHKQLPFCMLNLVVDPHPEIRNIANQSLDIIMVIFHSIVVMSYEARTGVNVKWY